MNTPNQLQKDSSDDSEPNDDTLAQTPISATTSALSALINNISPTTPLGRKSSARVDRADALAGVVSRRNMYRLTEHEKAAATAVREAAKIAAKAQEEASKAIAEARGESVLSSKAMAERGYKEFLELHGAEIKGVAGMVASLVGGEKREMVPTIAQTTPIPVNTPASPPPQIDAKALYQDASTMMRYDDLARRHGVEREALIAHFKPLIEHARAQRRKDLLDTQARLAIDRGNVTMLIWLGKQYLGQSDKSEEKSTSVNFNVKVNDLPF